MTMRPVRWAHGTSSRSASRWTRLNRTWVEREVPAKSLPAPLPLREAVVADAGVCHQSVIDEPLESRHHCSGWKERAWPVELIQIDPMHAESSRAASCSRPHHERQADRKKLGGDEHVAAPVSNRLADDALRPAEPVELRGVDEIDPQLQRPLDDRPRSLRRIVAAVAPLARAELPCPKSDGRQTHATDLEVSHALPNTRRS